MQTFFQLIRWKNLTYMLLTLCLLQWGMVNPILAYNGFPPVLTPLQLTLFVVALVCITAAGYCINDYFDTKIDAINHPNTRIVGRLIERRTAMLYHQLLTAVGVACGIILAVWLRSWMIGILFVFMPGMLWFYSSSYKRQFVVGNIIVALHAGLCVVMLAMTNAAAYNHAYAAIIEHIVENGHDAAFVNTQAQRPIVLIYAWLGAVALLLTLLVLIREVVKDCEDINGDRELECHTIPVKWGFKGAKAVVVSLAAVTIALVAWTVLGLIEMPDNGLTVKYMLVGVCVPLLVLCYLMLTAKTRADYKGVRSVVQFVMMVVSAYPLLFYYVIAKSADNVTFFGL